MGLSAEPSTSGFAQSWEPKISVPQSDLPLQAELNSRMHWLPLSANT
jgi:hypothetical protein